MGCESCKIIVRNALQNLKIQTVHVELGEADIKGRLSEKKKFRFNLVIKKAGLELLDNRKGVLLEKIKVIIIEYVNNNSEKLPINFSDYLSKKLNREYSYLSNYFSALQASTIEQYLISLKIERVKELILQTELSLKEISWRLHYSSVSHLSKQFKKVTGLTPSHFKRIRENRRNTIQSILGK
jgi:AraC-like DNA-binding protein